VIRTSLIVFVLVLNCVGWFWLVDRLDRIALQLGTGATLRSPAGDADPASTSTPAAAQGTNVGLEADINVAGVAAPQLFSADQIELEDAEPVIGVEVAGEARAYVVKAFEVRSILRIEDIGVHVVCDVVGGRSICVTHCDRSKQTRVLAGLPKPEESVPLDVRVGGWSDGMVLVVQGARYAHLSKEIPLEDVQFITTWGEWRARHPETLVYSRS
jgi:hypothetical protein